MLRLQEVGLLSQVEQSERAEKLAGLCKDAQE
jgi:hypothetical protein